ncbi:cation:proton antiporter [Methylomonas sp. MED-D]|uniref:Sodium:proton exchanger n=1 Tax=Methylomonas koyamae TaxID=702114 RepID=A0A177N1B6_9GAMM|nr:MULTISPECIES: cation:proton antiporter [Methylomonas]MDT4328420.1 cation:proton antiporter [Methylomonas sp. MV1]OAI11655.1 sodium:proton exchanger [Methylomonas koyamae]WGS88282.1 cation:proton antiporter [Methylomonas sp. UP202]
MESYRIALFVIALAAAFSPLLARIPTRFRMPVVATEMLLGMIIGPHIFNWVSPDGLVGMLGELGLTFLLFMVGMEINLGEIQGKPLTLAIGGWFLSFTVAMACMSVVHAIGLIQAPPLLAAVALSTTALGVLAPILRDEGILNTDFGKMLLSAAAMGEFGPLMVVSMLIIPTHSTFLHTVFILAFVGITFVIADTAINARSSTLIDLLAQTMQSSGQLPVRICIALQALLVVLAGEFGLNVVVGAFAAGMVVGLASKGEGGMILRQKLDAIGYGFLIPIFFIVAGMKFDVSALWANPLVPVQIICLLGLLILIRGVPVILYYPVLASNDRLPFALYSATGLPMIVIISEIGVSSGLMAPDRAAVLVSAGMISVLLFPLLAERIRQHS